MKTIEELNSKWYWRLIRVFYFLLLSIVVFTSCVWIFYHFHTYNPKIFHNTIATIEEREENIKWKLTSLRITFPKNEYRLNEFKDILKTKSGTGFIEFWDKEILYLALNLLMWMWKTIEGIERCDFINCETDIDLISSMLFSLENSWRIYLEESNIKEYNDYSEKLLSNYATMRKNLDRCLAHLDRYCSIEGEYDFKQLTGLGINIGYSEDYLWIIWWVKFILWVIWIIIVSLLLTLIMRWVSYYIILGKFNPEK